MKLADWVTLLFIAGLVLLWVLGRKKGIRMRAQALAAARLEGYQSAKAEAAATSTSMVNIASPGAGNVDRGELVELIRSVIASDDGSARLGTIGRGNDHDNDRVLDRGRDGAGGLHSPVGLPRGGSMHLSTGDGRELGERLRPLQDATRSDEDASGSNRAAVVGRRVLGRRVHRVATAEEEIVKGEVL